MYVSFMNFRTPYISNGSLYIRHYIWIILMIKKSYHPSSFLSKILNPLRNFLGMHGTASYVFLNLHDGIWRKKNLSLPPTCLSCSKPRWICRLTYENSCNKQFFLHKSKINWHSWWKLNLARECYTCSLRWW